MSVFAQKKAQLAQEGKLEEYKQGAKPIPVGTKIQGHIDTAEESDTRAGGTRLRVSVKIVKPEQFAGRYVNEGFNIDHENPDTVRIAFEGLTKLSMATGLDDLIDEPKELLGRAVQCEVRNHDEYNGRIYEQIGNWSEANIAHNTFDFTADDDLPF